jgi:GT2 family glycosyltransferase
MRKPIISVLITAQDRANLLAQVLDGLRLQTLAPSQFEVVLVDDGSREQLPALPSPVEGFTLRLPENEGRAYARNRGLEVVSGERVLFLDGDTVPDSRLLESHLLAAGENDARVVVGYKYHLGSSDYQEALKTKNVVLDPRERLYEENGDELESWPAPWQVCHTGNLSVSRNLLYSIGGFDERFIGWGGEDIEIGYRLHRAGGRYVLARGALAYHLMHPRNRDVERQHVRYNLRKLLLEKHRTLDAELFYGWFGDRYMQQHVRDVCAVSRDFVPTWHAARDVVNLPTPAIVFMAGDVPCHPQGWVLLNPSLASTEGMCALLGVATTYEDKTFSSAVISSAGLCLPRLFPAMLREAHRISHRVFVEDRKSEAVAEQMIREAGYTPVPPPSDGSMWGSREIVK